MTLTSGTLLPHSHDPWLVALSVLIAVAAAYTALDFAGRVRIRRGRERAAWLFGGAFAMGTGIWSMHFTGMLAFSLPVPVYYDVPTVMASHLAAVAASAAALHVASQQRLGAWAWWTGSVLMGGGIGVMHYTGMLALRLPGTMHHAPAMVALSVVLAVVVALVALRLTFKFRDGATGGSRWRKPVSALVMGLAIPALHYAAMAGASFISGDTLSGDVSHAVGSAQLGGTALIVGTVVVLGLALLAAYADRRITAARQEKEQALRHSEARLRAILEAALDCIITIDHEGRIVEFNPAAERTFGYRRAEVIGKEMAALMVTPALREGYRRSLATGEGPLLDGRMEIRVLRADGAEIPAEIAVTRIGVEGPPLFTAYLRDITDQKAARQALEATGARLQHLLVCSPTVIYSTAATGDYACSFISENLLELIGYQAAELVNDKDFWLERVHPDDKTRVLAEFEDTVPRERGAFEYRFRHKDGRYRWIQDSYRLTRGTKGQPLEIIGSWIDITARKETEAQRDRFFSLSLDLLCIAGTDGYFKRVNPAFGQTLGWSDEELLARPSLDFVHPEDVAATLLEVERLKTGQPMLQFENRYRCKDGGWRWLAWKAVAHPDGLLYSAARDVTGQREANRQLEQAKADAEQANRAKSAFLTTMSHEIRTPMNGVIGMAEVLAQSSLSAQQAELVTIIGASASALLGIIDDILDFSKIEAGRLEIERAPVSVADLVEEICNSQVPVAARSGVALALFVSPEIPAQVLSDDVRLRQVLYNLVGNAIKFSSAGPEHRGRVSVRVEVANATPLRLAFTIADNGIGMAPETLNGLFTPFTQAEVSTTRRFGGTGLGLAICKRLVDLMQGEIEVTSTPGVGSTFTVTQPFEAAAEQPVRSFPDLSGLDCIVVEKPGLDADDLRVYLEHAGAHVYLAADATAAAQAAASRAAPVVVIQYAGHERPAAATLRTPFASAPNVRHLLVARGQRRRARVDGPDVVTLDGDALRRQALLRAVAVAAGRTSPELFHESAGENLAGEEIAPPTIAEARAQGRLILVAEDDDINQKVILQQLRLLGYAAEVADNGTEALRLWREGNYALLLTDLHMPEMDGYTLAETIRREEAGRRRMPILALTANALRGEANRARSAGMDEYLTKPVQLHLLRAALEKWLPRINGSTPSAALPEESGGGRAAPVVDMAVLRGLVGDDTGTVREFLSDYLTSARRLTAELRAAVAAGDTQQVGAVAHKLKSSSCSVGALAFGDLCAGLESARRVGDQAASTQDMPEFDAALAAVEAEIAGLLGDSDGDIRIRAHENIAHR